MSRLTLMACTMLIFCSGSFGQTNYSILSGTITNPKSDSVAIFKNYRQAHHVIYLDSHNSFRDTLINTHGYYYFFDYAEQTKIYLENGYDLHLTLDTKQFDESIRYTGKGSVINNYLAKRELFNEGLGDMTKTGYWARLPENRFLKTQDSIYQLRKAFIAEHDLPKDFLFDETNKNDYGYWSSLAMYESIHQFFTKNDSFSVSPNFPDPFASIDLTNERLLGIPRYTDLVRAYLDEKVKAQIEGNEDALFYCTYLNCIGEYIPSIPIREAMAYQMAQHTFTYTSNIDSFYHLLKGLIVNPDYQLEITNTYNQLKRLEKGSPCPDFSFKDSSGNAYSLADFKGEYIYIDVWATWCGPCVAEAPYLFKLEKQFHNRDISFVSICMNDKKDSWLTYLRTKETSGIQLFAEADQTAFFEHFLINAIPRFLIIDREGKIVSHEALRPSSDELASQFEDLLAN
ncbi:MAG: TlpA family protein disulfide reductase [Bacteroidia bacterium]|nr:TlpA family protein disulfide reductase [Bacteroidia bacterium]